MGKHDLGTPINESLEKHYQDEKKRLEAKIAELENELNEAKVANERLRFRLRLKNIEIESLVKSMAGGELDDEI